MFKKIMKGISVLSLMLCTFCSLNMVSVNAANENNIIIEKEKNGYTLINENGKLYIQDNDLNKLSEFYTASGEKVSVEEAFDILTTDSTYDITPFALIPDLIPDTAAYNSNTQVNGTRVKVTPDYLGPATITSGTRKTISSSWSASISITAGIRAKIIAEIEANFSAGYISTSSTETYFSGTFSVPSGKVGAVYFTPYMTKHTVYYCDSNRVMRTITVTCPKQIDNGCADGLYALVIE
ncbi:hypothetical protein [uncultured Traorella sp.]|uniref:hypothetical protein n=1 Tax=uncultured Traorella sp. TaxID=1929048 RepID=UPI0025DC6BA6|nr:hypothetical protein [uncultured Traorella sp.]